MTAPRKFPKLSRPQLYAMVASEIFDELPRGCRKPAKSLVAKGIFDDSHKLTPVGQNVLRENREQDPLTIERMEVGLRLSVFKLGASERDVLMSRVEPGRKAYVPVSRRKNLTQQGLLNNKARLTDDGRAVVDLIQRLHASSLSNTHV